MRLVKRSELCALEIMGENFFAGLFLLCHACGSDLAQAHAVSPARAMEGITGRNISGSAIGLNNKRRTKQMGGGENAPDLELFADNFFLLGSTYSYFKKPPRRTALKRNECPYLAKVNAGF
jgi:hypothetical protein